MPNSKQGRHLFYLMAFATTLIFSSISSTSHAQTTMTAIYDTLSKLRADLARLPNLDDTITVGSIDFREAENNFLEGCFRFDILTYDSGRVSYTNPDTHSAQIDGIKKLTAKTQGGKLTYPNKLHLNLRFKIANWGHSDDARVAIRLGGRSLSAKKGDSEIVFTNVTDVNPSFGIGLGGFIMNSDINNKKISIGGLPLPGLLSFIIDTNPIDVGGFELPYVPVTLVFAPVVDAQKLNTASISKSTNRGVQVSLSFTNQDGSTGPTVSSYQETQQTQENLNGLYDVMSKIPIPLIQTIASGVKSVSTGLGSIDATETNSKTEVNSKSIKIAHSYTDKDDVNAKIGGPGEGDLFVYLLHPKFIWLKQKDQMVLSLVSSDGETFVSAGQLKRGSRRLAGKPADLKDDSLELNKESIDQLLALDPFVGGGPSIVPPEERFKPYGYRRYNVGAQGNGGQLSETITSEEQSTFIKTTMRMEKDSKGALSSLGMGVDENRVMQSTVSVSNIVQSSSSETYTSEYKFNGNGSELYSVEIYFDKLFGAFAFREVPKEEKTMTISGNVIAADSSHKSNAEVQISTHQQVYTVKTDANGNFQFIIPQTKSTYIKLSSGSKQRIVKISGKSASNLTLQAD